MIVLRVRERGPLALAAALATATLYAEGVLKSGWIEVALLAPVGWFLAVSGAASRLQNLLLSLIAVCVTLTGLDLALRPLMGQRLHYTPANVATRKLPKLPIVGRWDPHLAFDMDSYGDLAALAGEGRFREPRRIVFRTDSAGFRNVAEEGPFDLLVLGDSFSAGAGTTDDETFARLLATRYGHHPYNLSYPGGPYDQFVNFAIESPRLAFAPGATIVWAFYTGNDLDDAGGDIWEVDKLPWRGLVGQWQVEFRTFRNRSPLNQWMQALRWRWRGQGGGVIVREMPDRRAMLFQHAHEVWGTRSRAEVEAHPNFQKLERTMVAMRDLASARRLPITILILPTKGEVYRWVLDRREPAREDTDSSGFAQSVLGLCVRLQLRCADTKPYLVEEARRAYAASGELLWWRDDTHWGEHGHAAVAEFIARRVLP